MDKFDTTQAWSAKNLKVAVYSSRNKRVKQKTDKLYLFFNKILTLHFKIEIKFYKKLRP